MNRKITGLVGLFLLTFDWVRVISSCVISFLLVSYVFLHYITVMPMLKNGCTEKPVHLILSVMHFFQQAEISKLD